MQANRTAVYLNRVMPPGASPDAGNPGKKFLSETLRRTRARFENEGVLPSLIIPYGGDMRSIARLGEGPKAEKILLISVAGIHGEKQGENTFDFYSNKPKDEAIFFNNFSKMATDKGYDFHPPSGGGYRPFDKILFSTARAQADKTARSPLDFLLSEIQREISVWSDKYPKGILKGLSEVFQKYKKSGHSLDLYENVKSANKYLRPEGRSFPT